MGRLRFHTMALAHSVIFRGEKADDHQQVYCGSQWAMAEGGNSIEHRVYIESVNSLWYSIRVIHFFFRRCVLEFGGEP